MNDLPIGDQKPVGAEIPTCPHCENYKKIARDYLSINKRLQEKNTQLFYKIRQLMVKIRVIKKAISESESLAEE